MSKVGNAIKEYRQFGLAHVAGHICSTALDGLFRAAGKLFFTKIPLKNVIIIESHNDFDCNGGAFYQFLLDNGINKQYRIVWLLRNRKPKDLPPNVICFDFFKPNLKKEYYCCLARFILNDDKFIEKRREGQICVYCTHGAVGLKNTHGLINVPEYVDYILSPSAWYDPFLCREYSIDYPNEQMLHPGFPSNDLLFNGSGNECWAIREKHYSQYILWMPTFRSNSKDRNDSEISYPLGIPLINSMDELELINNCCREHDCLLIIKLHPMQIKESYRDLKEMSHIAVLDGEKTKRLGIDNCRLMRSCHAMISDYSSAPYSFLMLNRPIAFDFSDLPFYKLGLNELDIDEFTPGKRIYSLGDMLDFLNSCFAGDDDYREAREHLLHKLYEYCDGNASYRLAVQLGLLQSDEEKLRKNAE